jgi:MoaA/NifB/PqqE/SkfB family radical SAM enzyme
MADLPWKLWIYTNFDCNLSCTYCVAQSSPRAERRAIGLAQVQRLVDEAAELNFARVYLTGGEPFLLDDIYAMLAYAAERLPTTVLTNGMLLKGRRLAQLRAVAHPNLTVQVSLDGGRPQHHDSYRGAGSWAETVAGIRTLLQSGFHVRLGTTVTPLNSAHLNELCAFHLALGIPEEDHFTRPLARRGFSQDGLVVTRAELLPEITVTADGIFWHPLTTDNDMLVRRELFPLAEAICCVRAQLATPPGESSGVGESEEADNLTQPAKPFR